MIPEKKESGRRISDEDRQGGQERPSVGARGFECAKGAQALLRDCFVRLRRTPTVLEIAPANSVLDQISGISLFLSQSHGQGNLQCGGRRNPQAAGRLYFSLMRVLSGVDQGHL
jgi:hypothetical protein